MMDGASSSSFLSASGEEIISWALSMSTSKTLASIRSGPEWVSKETEPTGGSSTTVPPCKLGLRSRPRVIGPNCAVAVGDRKSVVYGKRGEGGGGTEAGRCGRDGG